MLSTERNQVFHSGALLGNATQKLAALTETDGIVAISCLG